MQAVDAETEARYAEERERRARRRERMVDPLGVADRPSDTSEAIGSGVEPVAAAGVLVATWRWLRRAVSR